MSLTDFERKLLTRARERIAESTERCAQFVCVEVQYAYMELREKKLAAVEDADLMWALRGRIERTLGFYTTLETFFYRESGIRPPRLLPEGCEDSWDRYGIPKREITYLPFAEFYNLTNMARLAWIDRMLDNNEVS